MASFTVKTVITDDVYLIIFPSFFLFSNDLIMETANPVNKILNMFILKNRFIFEIQSFDLVFILYSS